MSTALQRMKRRLRRGAKRAAETLVGALAVGLLEGLRLVNPDRMANFAGWLMRRIGPLLPEQHIGRANLAAAFPENPRPRSKQFCAGVWDNLGRMGAEFAHLDRLWDLTRRIPSGAAASNSRAPNIERFARLARTASRR